MLVAELCWVAASMEVNVEGGHKVCKAYHSVRNERIFKLREQGMQLKETRQTRGSTPNPPAQEVAARRARPKPGRPKDTMESSAAEEQATPSPKETRRTVNGRATPAKSVPSATPACKLAARLCVIRGLGTFMAMGLGNTASKGTKRKLEEWVQIKNARENLLKDDCNSDANMPKDLKIPRCIELLQFGFRMFFAGL